MDVSDGTDLGEAPARCDASVVAPPSVDGSRYRLEAPKSSRRGGTHGMQH